MPTVIDSLVVELGLDPTKFNQQQQDALDRLNKFGQDAERGGKNVEDSSRKSGEALNAVKNQALQLFAVLSGGKGLVQFGMEATRTNAQLGRLERNLGVSASTINKWQGAARIFGGDAQTMAQSFTTMSDALAGWKVGIVSPIIADFRAIGTAGGTVIDINKGVEQSFLDLSANLKSIHEKDPALASMLGRKAGIDPALYDLMIRGPESLKKVLEYVNKIGVATKEDTDAFGELEKRINLMGVKAESLGRKLLGGKGGVADGIVKTADFLQLTPSEAWAKIKSKWNGSSFGDRDAKPTHAQQLFPENENPGSFRNADGTVKDRAKLEGFIRKTANEVGIDPNEAVRVAKTEGFNQFVSSVPGERSYGAFQLNRSKTSKASLGDMFLKDTGLDPSDPANEAAGIKYALKYAATSGRGWADWYGARNNGISQFSGIPRGGDKDTVINISKVEINSPGGDGKKIAEDFKSGVMQRQSMASQSNSGQQ